MELIDTHLHLIDPARFPFAKGAGGYQPGPEEYGDRVTLEALMARNGVSGGVLVQPSTYGTDNAAILDLVRRSPVRFRAVTMTEDPLAASAHPGLVGARINLTDYAPHSSSGPAIQMATAILDADLIMHLQAPPALLTLVLAACGSGPVVLDHFGRPDLAEDDQTAAVAALARRAQTYLKVSGPFRLGGFKGLEVDDARLTRLIDAFGPERCIWGSDWPFINLPDRLRPGYGQVIEWGARVLDLGKAADVAAKVYGFG